MGGLAADGEISSSGSDLELNGHPLPGDRLDGPLGDVDMGRMISDG